MKEKKRLQTSVHIAYGAALLLMVIFAVYMSFAEHLLVVRTRTFEPVEAVQHFDRTTVEDPSAPAGIRKVYRVNLPAVSPTRNCLAFYTVHHEAEVRIGTELVYQLAADAHNRIGTSPSSNWIFIPLEASDTGKDVEITLTPVYREITGYETTFYLGARSDLVVRLLKLDFPQIILSILCILIGLVLSVIQPYYILRRRTSSWKLFYLGGFLALLGLWRLTDISFAPILFSENPLALGYISIASLFICSIPLLLFLGEYLTGRKRSVLLAVALTDSLLTLAVLICQIGRIAELRELLPLCHIMLLVNMAVILIACVSQAKASQERFELIALVLLLVPGAIMDLLLFYVKHSSSGAMFTLLALLIYTVVRFSSELLDMNRKVHFDAQTGLLNRRQWNDLMESSEPIHEPIGIMMLDLNRLKHINDTLGHQMGDKLILNFAAILAKALPADCRIYRWGGDEFTVLVPNADLEKMKRCISEILAKTEAHNASGEKPEIHFAVGYALSTDYPSFSREELMKKADEKMYHHKSAWYDANHLEHHL